MYWNGFMNTKESMKSVAVVGAGAAWLMAVATLLEWWYAWSVTLYEKNKEVWTKVRISGWWRCNVTTGTVQRKELLKHYPRGSEFLDYAFREFWPRQVRKWFEDHGVPLKQEADGRIFPVSDQWWDVVGVFKRMMNQYNTMILKSSTSVESITNTEEKFQLHTSWWVDEHDILVVTTGGQAYAHTWSTGDGYAFARACGHTITELGPSLNSFVTKELWHADLSGTVFEDAMVTHAKWVAQWPVLLTHFGLSGPCMFVVASQIPFVTVDAAQPYSVRLAPHASMRVEQRLTWFKQKRQSDPKQSMRVWLTQFFTKRTSELLCSQFGWNDYTFTTLSKNDAKEMATHLGEWLEFELIKRRPWDEFVTAWGVVTDEVNAKTMESTLSAGLYFAWEVLNVDGVTGGYNLQASRAAGRLAGQSILQSTSSDG